MQENAAESLAIASVENSSETPLFGCSDSINNHLMSPAIVPGDLPYGHIPNRLSTEPQMNNNQFMEHLLHGCNVVSGVNSLFKTANYGGLSSRWDFNKFLSPSQELLDRALARTGVHSIPWTGHVSNDLSLSLSMSERPQFMQGPNIQPEMSSPSGETLQKRISPLDRTSCSSYNNFSSNDDKSPFMAGTIIFLQAMQEILAEIAFYAVENVEQMAYSPSSSSGGDGRFMLQRESEEKRKLLVSLLQLVDDRYSQCIDEIHTVVSAFHAVTELDPNLHARFALPTISFMCKNLRERISAQILAMGSHNSSSVKEKSFEASYIQKQWALQQLKKRDQQLWRPQRGLPERSVSVLRAWMFQNFLHPYPKDAEKHLLALKSGLTRSQVSNWFINARVRLWKPMIEEMYAEMNQRKAGDNESNTEANLRNHMRIVERRFAAADGL